MRVFDFLALGFNIALAVNLVGIFFTAAFNDSGLLITTNSFGEQKVEMVLFPLVIVMGLISLYRMGKNLNVKGKGNENKKVT